MEGQNLAIAYRAAEGQVEPLSELVTDLLRLQVEVLVTAGGISATYAAKAATSTLPIVMVTSGDLVQAGWPKRGRQRFVGERRRSWFSPYRLDALRAVGEALL